MDRRRFLLTSLGAVIPAPLTAWGQEPGKIWRIGILSPVGQPSPEDMARGAFIVAMRDLGWVDGRNVLYQRRYANGRFELLPSLAAELLASDVHVILSVGSLATRAAKEATATTSIVFGEVGQPVQQGLVASLSRPGGNVTGVADVSFELMPKRLELLKELVPRAKRVAILVNPQVPPGPWAAALDASKDAALKLGLRLETFEVLPATDLDATFARIRQSRSEALTIIPEALFMVHRARIAELALKNHLPFVAEHPLQAEAGAVLVYNYNTRHIYQLAATYVDQILKGAKPADLPVQEPSRHELIINRKTAKAIGLKVPQLLLDRADRLIE